ncbi:hypothetical protein ACFL6B_03170, partial [Thermodesulfobacteriota bacterium]
MPEFKIMMFEAGNEQKMRIRSRIISKWCKVDSFVPDKEELLSQIMINMPDVVLFDLNLYAKIDGIKTTQTI